MTVSEWTLAIDFGTSNTAAAHTNPVRGTVEAVNLYHNSKTMPSAVYIESPASILTGEVAFNAAQDDPSGYVPSPKRVIPQGSFQIKGFDIDAAAPVTAVLESVIAKASREHGGSSPTKLILTHPEAWSDREIGVLLTAAQQAGVPLDSIETISEPKAAAHYYTQDRALKAGEKFAVFDFGGGTLDVAVLEAQDNNAFNVIAAQGDNTLGGKSFDALIRRWVDQQLEDEDPDLLDNLRRAPLAERHALEENIRKAKELLSEAASATIAVAAGGLQTRLQITRTEFESIIQAPLDKAVALTRATLAEAGIASPSELKALYLTGGTTRVPIVQDALKDLGPVSTLDDPKTVTAQGAITALAERPETETSEVAPAAPSTVEQQTVTPTASTDSAAEIAKTSRTRNIGTSIFGLVAIVALAAGGWFFINQPSPSSDPADPTQVVDGPDPTIKSVDSVQALRGLLPKNIEAELTTCMATSGTTTGALSVRCEMRQNSEDMKYFTQPQGDWDPTILNFTMDENEARSQRAQIRDETRRQGARELAGPIKNAQDTRAAVAWLPSYSNDVEMSFAATDIPMTISSRDFKSADDAIEWVRSKGLLD